MIDGQPNRKEPITLAAPKAPDGQPDRMQRVDDVRRCAPGIDFGAWRSIVVHQLGMVIGVALLARQVELPPCGTDGQRSRSQGQAATKGRAGPAQPREAQTGPAASPPTDGAAVPCRGTASRCSATAAAASAPATSAASRALLRRHHAEAGRAPDQQHGHQRQPGWPAVSGSSSHRHAEQQPAARASVRRVPKRSVARPPISVPTTPDKPNNASVARQGRSAHRHQCLQHRADVAKTTKMAMKYSSVSSSTASTSRPRQQRAEARKARAGRRRCRPAPRASTAASARRTAGRGDHSQIGACQP